MHLNSPPWYTASPCSPLLIPLKLRELVYADRDPRACWSFTQSAMHSATSFSIYGTGHRHENQHVNPEDLNLRLQTLQRPVTRPPCYDVVKLLTPSCFKGAGIPTVTRPAVPHSYPNLRNHLCGLSALKPPSTSQSRTVAPATVPCAVLKALPPTAVSTYTPASRFCTPSPPAVHLLATNHLRPLSHPPANSSIRQRSCREYRHRR